jgi:hypothetical protein
MASPGDYKELYLKWLNKTHTVGSPDLDALIDISNSISASHGVTTGELKVISRDLDLTTGASIGFKITATGGTFIKYIHAEGFNIKYLSILSGTISDTGTDKSLNLTGNDDFDVNYVEYSSVTFNLADVVISHASELNIGIYSDNEVYAIITNDTAETISSAFTIGVEKINDFTSTLGLMPDTNLQPTTEMSNYG